MSTAGSARFPEQISRWYRGHLKRGLRGCLGRSKDSQSPWRRILDRFDERRARRLRSTLGRRQWLVSWQRIGDGDGDGPWLARLSCPLLVSTLERTGKTRAGAIGRAARALTLLLAFRDEINRRTVRPGRDPDSPDDPWC